MEQSSLYASQETMLTLFYEEDKLYQVPGRPSVGRGAGALTPFYLATLSLQLVYLTHGKQGHLVKRLVPVEKLLLYQQLNHFQVLQQG